MSKFTISAIVAIVRLILGILAKVLRLVDVIRDLLDDGSINGSLKNKWSETFEKIDGYVLDVVDFLNEFQDSLPESVTKDSYCDGLESYNSKE